MMYTIMECSAVACAPASDSTFMLLNFQLFPVSFCGKNSCVSSDGCSCAMSNQRRVQTRRNQLSASPKPEIWAACRLGAGSSARAAANSGLLCLCSGAAGHLGRARAPAVLAGCISGLHPRSQRCVLEHAQLFCADMRVSTACVAELRPHAFAVLSIHLQVKTAK